VSKELVQTWPVARSFYGEGLGCTIDEDHPKISGSSPCSSLSLRGVLVVIGQLVVGKGASGRDVSAHGWTPSLVGVDVPCSASHNQRASLHL
jgi:hypothetical protein